MEDNLKIYGQKKKKKTALHTIETDKSIFIIFPILLVS